jgi:hypothetical protein
MPYLMASPLLSICASVYRHSAAHLFISWHDILTDNFLFLTFYKNILKITPIKFYLHPVTLLLAPLFLARQRDFTATLHAAR